METIEYKGELYSKVTITSGGDMRIKIAVAQRNREKDIVQFCREFYTKHGIPRLTFRSRINFYKDNCQLKDTARMVAYNK